MTEEETCYCQESSSKIQETFTSKKQVKIDVQKVSSLIKCTLFVMCIRSSTDQLLQNQSQLL